MKRMRCIIDPETMRLGCLSFSDLTKGEVYITKEDPFDDDWIRVWDDSGEDYLYPREYFDEV